MCVNHPEGIAFSIDKPNLIVGPNGSGKTALMTALSLLTLSHYLSRSALDNHYVQDSKLWSTTHSGAWKRDLVWLPGLDFVTDYAPAAFFRPSHVPGNQANVTAAMMYGYSREARDYGNQVDDKSSGQQGWSLLSGLMKVVSGEDALNVVGAANWTYTQPVSEKRSWHSDNDDKAALLRARYTANKGGIPTVLMDEPESSLDAKTEMMLWQQLARPAKSVQIIVATHSLWPIMHPEPFHIIETEPGYCDDVRSLIATKG